MANKNFASIIFITTLFSLYSFIAEGQIRYSFSTEVGYLNFQNNTIDVDPGPNWRGYYLEGQNGMSFNMVNGIAFKDKVFTGIGLGYLNFEGISGLTGFFDLQYVPLTSKLSPLGYFNLGYSHIWNQYENGKNTALAEIGLGLQYRIQEKRAVYFKFGGMATQQSWLYAYRVGFRF